MFEFRLFGAPVLLREETPVRILQKPLAMLAFLSLEKGRPHERVFLSDLFWPDHDSTGGPTGGGPTRDPARADHNLRMALYTLRKSLDLPDGASLFSDLRNAVRLNPDFPLETDVSRLLAPPPSCALFHDPEDCPSCEARLARGIREIGGPFMDGFSLPGCEEFEVWTTGRREELESHVKWSVNRLVRLYEKRSTPHEALAVLSGALAMDPTDEACHGRTMLLLAETGNTMAALAQYETCRKTLRDALGVEPDAETRAIYEKIRASSRTPSLSPPALREPLFPDLAFSPEWRPATALYVEFPTEGREETFSKVPPELEAALTMAAKRAEEAGGTPGRRETRSFLVWFGISGQPEGAARRSARAALAIQSLVHSRGANSGTRIPFVCGIHSGRILRGAPGAPPDPTGTVSRSVLAISMQAEGGTILVSRSAARLLKGQFLLEEAGEIRILGQRTKGFLLRGETGDAKEAGDDSAPPPLFGRERDLAILRDLWEKNSGGALVVEGEAGIGKSALLRAFLSQPTVREAFLRKVECFPQSMESPFYPVVRMLRGPAGVPEGTEAETAYPILLSYVRSLSLSEERTAVALLGSFFSLPPHQDFPLPNLPSAGLREETSRLLLSILRARAREGRVLFVIEDLHWTDASTGDLFRRILSDPVFTKSVFFLLTTRTGEDPPWIATLPERVTLRLSPLSEAESREMVRSLSHASPLPPEEISRILAAADGVPLFLEELTRERIEAAGETSPPLLPSTLAEVLASRLDRLASARLLLQRAAVYGRTVPMDLLRALSPEPPDLFDALLDRVLLSGLAQRESDPSGELLAIRHALIAEASLQTLSEANCRLLHRQIAETLRDRFPERASATPEIVARHFEGAGDLPLALPWFEKAARQSYANGALSESEHLVLKALECLSAPPLSVDARNDRIRLLILKGSILVDLYGYGNPLATAAFREATSLFETGSFLTEEAFYALHGFFETLYGGADLRELRRVSDSLLEMSRDRKSADFPIVALWASGSADFWEGRFETSLAKCDQCLALGETTDRSENLWSEHRRGVLVQAWSYRLWSLWFLGRYRSAKDELDRALDWVSDPQNSKKIGHLLTFALILIRFFRLPDRIFPAADTLCESIRTLKTEGWTPSEQGFRGWAMVMKGTPGGLPLVLRSVALSRRYHRLAEVTYLSLLSETYLALKAPRKAEGVADSALRFSERSGTHFFDAELWRLKGEAALLEKKREEARECFGRAIEISRRQGARALELRAATSLGRVLREDGKRKEALALMSEVSDLLEGPESIPALPDIREALELERHLS